MNSRVGTLGFLLIIYSIRNTMLLIFKQLGKILQKPDNSQYIFVYFYKILTAFNNLRPIPTKDQKDHSIFKIRNSRFNILISRFDIQYLRQPIKRTLIKYELFTANEMSFYIITMVNGKLSDIYKKYYRNWKTQNKSKCTLMILNHI